MTKKPGMKLPARPQPKVPESHEVDDWIAAGSRSETEPAPPVDKNRRNVPAAVRSANKEEQVRITVRCPASLKQRFELALVLSGRRNQDVLCEKMEEFAQEQGVSAAKLRRLKAAG